jgi:hypothetical protein
VAAVPGRGFVRVPSAAAALARSPLLVVAVLAVLPRLGRLGASLWNDETFSTHLRLGFSRDTFAWMAYDTHPPLYNVIMLLWVSVFGDSAVSIRMLPLLCSAASVFYAGRVATWLLGSAGGLLAATLLALSGASVFYAHEARSYSFIILLFLVLADSVLRYHARGDEGGLRRVTVFSVLCAMSHVYAFLFVVCLWVLLLFTARTPQAVRGVSRAALVPPAVAAPFYFLIALMVLFTREHQYLWQGMTESFRPRDAGALLSFYLFGYGGLNTLPLAQVLAAALFVAGVVAALRRGSARDTPEVGVASAGFAAPWLPRLFAAAVACGLVLSAAALTAPGWLPVARIQAMVGANKHPDLVAALPQLLSRTGALYLAAYVALLTVWVALGPPERPRPLGRLVGRLAGGSRPLLEPAQIVVALPFFAIVLVVAISTLRPTFNSRYMLPLLPFGLVTMAVALWRVSAPRLRAVLVSLVVVSQAASLFAQQEAYALLKPDYRGALEYASRIGRPVTGTAVWELENLSRYYAGRGEVGPVRVLSRPESAAVDGVLVFVPAAYPLDAPHLAELRERVRAGTRREVSFQGLTLYELEGRR